MKHQPKCWFYGRRRTNSKNYSLLDAKGINDLTPDEFPLEPFAFRDRSLVSPRNWDTRGKATLWRTNGWTIITFVENSPPLPFFNSTQFIFDAELDFETAVSIAEMTFPKIWERFDFEVREG